jgi:hypothetical protein
MNGIDLITGSIEELIAAVPQLVIVLTTIIYSLNAIKSRVNVYPKIASDTKDDVNANLAGMKGKLEGILNVSQEKINQLLADSKDGLFKLVKQANEEAEKQLKKTLSIMEVELASYKNQLATNIEQTNLLARQNKLFADVILELVAQDPKKVSAGIAQAVSTKINLTQEELEKYPEVLVKDIKVLESALKEAFALMGKESFEELLKNIGYEKEND